MPGTVFGPDLLPSEREARRLSWNCAALTWFGSTKEGVLEGYACKFLSLFVYSL